MSSVVKPFVIDNFRGLANVGRHQKLSKELLSVAHNIDIDNNGVVRRRAGSNIVYSSATASGVMTDGRDLLFREGTSLKRMESDGTATTLRSDLTATDRSLKSLLINELGSLFYSDGITTGVYQDRFSRSWGLSVPPAPVVAATVGDLLAGAYQVALTYMRNDGQESGASSPVFIDAPAGGFTVSVQPSADPGVVGICVYISSVDGRILYRQAVMANDTASFTISGGIMASGMECITLNMQAPIAGEYLCFYRGRVYVASGPTIRCTEPLNYELMSMDRNHFPFPADVTMMIPVEGGIWVATANESMMMAGTDPQADGGMQIRGRNGNGAVHGCSIAVGSTLLSAKGIAPGMVAMWMSKEGIMAGDSTGNAINLTGDYFVPPADATDGWACLVKEDGMDRVMFGLKTGVGNGSSAIVVTTT